MKSPAQDVAQLIVNGGLGVLGADRGWSINIGWLPEQPDTTIVVYDMPGGESMDGDGDLYTSVVQVRVAARDYGVAYSKAFDVQRLLVDVLGVTVNSTRYVSIEPNDTPTATAKTDTNITPVVQNFTVMRQVPTT